MNPGLHDRSPVPQDPAVPDPVPRRNFGVQGCVQGDLVVEHDLDPHRARQHRLATALADHHADHFEQEGGRAATVPGLRGPLEIRGENCRGPQSVQLEELDFQAAAEIGLHGLMRHIHLA
jgi:hypothetical protein